MQKRWICGVYVTSLSALGVLLIGSAGSVKAERKGSRALLVFQTGERSSGVGHPNSDFAHAIGASQAATEQTPTPDVILPSDPPESPLATGSFVNFESPPVKALALSQAGTRLFAANTPNDTLVVYDTTQSPLAVLSEIPVGVDPVSVAVQPGTNSSLVWVANFISDNVSVVDVAQGRIVDVIEVGDEPVNILFDADGSHAFVVVQGTPSVLDTSPNAPTGVSQEGALVAIDTSNHQIIRSLYLNMHTPRAAGTLNNGARIAVAALHSGNNTTIVGTPITLKTVNQNTGVTLDIPTNALAIVQFFSVTAPIFADPSLSPYPDLGAEPDAPPVERIVPDSGADPNAWADIVAALSTPAGDPDPLVVAQLQAEIEAGFPNLAFTNVQEVVQEIINDARDTDDNDLVIVDTADLITPPTILPIVPTSITSNVGTILTGMGVNPTNNAIFISNLEALNLVRLEPNLQGHFFDHLITVVDSAGAVNMKTDLHAAIQNFNDTQTINSVAQAGSLANPVDIVFRADGSRAYVASLGTGRIGVLDGANGTVLGLTDVGRGTRSLALDQANNRLYAFNRTDMSIAVIDVSSDSPTLLETRPMFDPEPPVIRNGRDFLYSTRFTNNFASSCAMCHIDAGFDNLSWDLGDPNGVLGPTPHIIGGLLDPCIDRGGVNHPLKGPMFTLSLQGLADHTPLHWRGDKPDFTFFNGAFDSLLGGTPLTPAQMQAYADFTDTIVYPPNQFHNHDNSFKDPGASIGRDVYINNCNSCHQLTHDGAMTFDCIATDAGFDLAALNIFPQLQLTTQLRGISKKLDTDRFSGFGLVHDGREKRGDNDNPLDTFLQNFFPGIIEAGLNDELEAFVSAYTTNVMPIVGFQTIAESANNAGALTDVDLMIGQSALIPSRNDVVAKGLVGGASRGYVLIDPGAKLFQSDLDEMVTLDDLIAQLSGSDYLLFTSVPPGSGARLGINQDLDCASDGHDPFPQKNPDLNQDGVVDGADLAALLINWGDAGALGPADFDDLDGVTGFDLALLLTNWGTCSP